MKTLLLISALLLTGLRAADAPDADWRQITWLGEKALASTSHGWTAIVSLERGRLMQFGPADTAVNLLLAPPTRGNPNLWGGHRVWLGPQSTWAAIWPPPKEWELSGPKSFTTDGGSLRMLMADARDGWPQLTRTYRWDGAKLVCGVELRGGARAAQIIQIFQVPAATVVHALARPAEGFPAGYVRLPSSASQFAAGFAQPPQVARAGDALTLRHTGAVEKLGFRPQPLTGRAGEFSLTVSRGAQTGTAADEPDEGFHTQVYLSGRDAFVELEQLSPLFVAGEPASFAVVLEGARRP